MLPIVIDELADNVRRRAALLSERECFSYRALAERANRYARWALAQGIAKGDVVCLLMPNRPGLHGDLARDHARRRGCRAAQHQSRRAVARALHQHRRAQAYHRRRANSSMHSCRRAPHLDDAATVWSHGGERDISADRSGRSTHSEATLCGARRATGRRASTTARSTSTRPAPPACRRRRMSVITA